MDWAQPKQRSHTNDGTETSAAAGLDAARAASKQNAAAVAAEIASLIAGKAAVIPGEDRVGAAEGQHTEGADSLNSCGAVATGSAHPAAGSNLNTQVCGGEGDAAGDTNEIQMDDY